MGTKTCACGCGSALPADADPRQKYVDEKHRRRMEARRYRAKKRDKAKPRRYDAKPLTDQSRVYKDADESKDGRGSARRGPKYEAFLQTPWPALLQAGEVSQDEVCTELGESQANISRWMKAYREDQAKAVAQEKWSRDTTVEQALEDFAAFCRRYWPDDQVTEFHMEWADLISEAIDTGGRVMLLAPQRHGKSHLLRKYCTWRIAQDPDIRILWVSQSQDLAEKAVGYVLDILTGHEQLIQEVLGPGQEFRPPTRQNMSWTSSQFTVGCRTKVQASPTMVALGKGGSILSRDADVIICDDLQEHKHIRSPGQRETDNEWFFTDLMSRKLPHTGLAFIGSRQHLQDVQSEVMKKPEQWTIKVYPVHDPACAVAEDDHEAHRECMLWPEQYPHWYMEEQRAQQGEAYFQRNMMNNPKSDATVLVSAKDIDRCKDETRRAGELPKGVTRLVAGIDPADAKPVAAVLWGHEPDWGDRGRRHIIDIMEADAGLRGGRQVVREWKQKYGCDLFVIESNMAQSWLEDAELRDFCAANGVILKPQYTSASTKWSASTGVVAMFGRMRTDPPSITIPWGDRETVKKMERLVKTYLMFDPDYANNKHADDDLPMASWFPQLTMDGWITQFTQSAVVDYRQTPYVPGRTAYIPMSSPYSREVA